MNRQDELLTILAEECAEVIVECSKIKRFGLDSEYDGMTAQQRLVKELGDLQCMIALLQEDDIVSYAGIEEASASKKEKLMKWSNLFNV